MSAPTFTIDLFGQPVADPIISQWTGKAKRNEMARGYAAPPGSGPASETCGSCRHLHRNSMSKTYLKCALMRAHWTGGPKTDIRAKSPACARWEAPALPPSGYRWTKAGDKFESTDVWVREAGLDPMPKQLVGKRIDVDCFRIVARPIDSPKQEAFA